MLLLAVCFSHIHFTAGMRDEIFIMILKLSKNFIPCSPWENSGEFCASFFGLLWFVLMFIDYIHNFLVDVRPWKLNNTPRIHTFKLVVLNLSICNTFHYKWHLMTYALLIGVLNVYSSGVLCLCIKALRNCS